MPLLTRMGATLQCSFGAAPVPLTVVDPTSILEDATPAANIMDPPPFVNIMAFGMCTSIANPTVAAATAAALGVLTPMPCIPATPAPWVAGAPTVLLGNFSSLDNVSPLMCMWAGVITFVDAGEATVQIP